MNEDKRSKLGDGGGNEEAGASSSGGNLKRLPQDLLLNIVSNFVFFSSTRVKELYKTINDSSLKGVELLDMKAHFKLLEIAHTLLKLWDDSRTLNGQGLQNYFKKLLPSTDWSQEELKASFNNLLRRIDRSFSKISKKQSLKKQLDWLAIAGILDGLYLTLDKQEGIAHLPYFKIMINTIISLISNEISTDLSTGILNSGNANAPSGGGGLGGLGGLGSALGGWNSGGGGANRSDLNFQMPIVFSKSLIKLVGRYVNALKEQFNLEQIFGSNNVLGPNTPNGLVYLINFLLPLLLWGASNKKDSPQFNSDDLSYVVTMLLNSLKPPSKLAASLLLTAPKQHHLATAFDTNANAAANMYNKTARHIKDLINQSAFLALKLLVYSFCKQLDLNKIAMTIKQICQKVKTVYLWKFLEFITTNRTTLFLMLKPYIENFIATQNCDNETESAIRDSIQAKLNCCVMTNMKCTNIVLWELINELNAIKTDLQEYNESCILALKHFSSSSSLSGGGGGGGETFFSAKTKRATIRLRKKTSTVGALWPVDKSPTSQQQYQQPQQQQQQQQQNQSYSKFGLFEHLRKLQLHRHNYESVISAESSSSSSASLLLLNERNAVGKRNYYLNYRFKANEANDKEAIKEGDNTNNNNNNNSKQFNLFDLTNFYHLRKTKKYLESKNMRSSSFSDLKSLLDDSSKENEENVNNKKKKASKKGHYDATTTPRLKPILKRTGSLEFEGNNNNNNNVKEKSSNPPRKRVVFFKYTDYDKVANAESKVEQQKSSTNELDSVAASNEGVNDGKKAAGKDPMSPSKLVNSPSSGGAHGQRFLLNKSRKEKKEPVSFSIAGNVIPTTQSMQPAPRKKFEKLNYKSGIDILEAYKEKYKKKLIEANKDAAEAAASAAAAAAAAAASEVADNNDEAKCSMQNDESGGSQNKPVQSENEEKIGKNNNIVAKSVDLNQNDAGGVVSEEKDKEEKKKGKVKKIMFV